MAEEEFKTLNQAASSALETEGEASRNIVFPAEANIVSLELKKQSDTGEPISFKIIPWESEVIGTPPLSTIQFKESLFDGCMFGSMVVFDDRNWVDDFQFNGKEEIKIDFKISDSEKPVSFEFTIYDAKSISDETYVAQSTSADERISVWRLEFMSKDVLFQSFQIQPLEYIDGDFYGNLSKVDDNVGTSFIQTLFNYFGFDHDVKNIEDSRTGVWFKYDRAAYPWMKQKGQTKIIQLLKYLSNYAWDGDTNNYHADYFCWQDREGWNFKSITGMISDPETGKVIDPVEGFIITIDVLNKNKIHSFQVINEYNFQGLLDSGALVSAYTRIDPNYENTYLDFTDSKEAFTKKSIVYDYETSKDDIPRIETYPLLPDKFLDGLTAQFSAETRLMKDLVNYSIRVDDEIYGYFDKNYLNTPYQQEWDVYGKNAGISGESLDYSKLSSLGPWSDTAYQPQFDMVDMNFSTLLEIKKLRQELYKKRAEYAAKKNIKRKWEVYRCTICCSENAALGSTKDVYNIINPGPVNGLTYNLLFGATGYYGIKQDEKYQVVAAGSFTDLLNYDSGATLNQRGLTYSYDLTKAPYNESIGEFYNLTGPTIPLAYNKYVVERALTLYRTLIEKITDRIEDLKDFINNPNRVSAYKQKADEIFSDMQQSFATVGGSIFDSFYAPNDRPVDPLVDGFKFVGEAIQGENYYNWPIKNYEFGLVPDLKLPRFRGLGQVIWDKNLPTQTCATFAAGITQSDLCGLYVSNPRSTEDPQPDQEFTYDYSFFGGGYMQIYYRSPIDGYYYHSYDRGVTAYAHKIEIFYPLFNNQANPEYRAAVSSGYFYDDASEGLSGSEFTLNDEFLQFLYTPGITNTNELNYDKFIVKITPFFRGSRFSDYHSWDFRIGCPNTGDPRQNYRILFDPSLGLSGYIPQTIASPLDIVNINPYCYAECSNDPVIRGYINFTATRVTNGIDFPYGKIYSYAAPYLWDEGIKDWSFFDYGTDKGLFPSIIDENVKQRTKNCLASSDCINNTCLSSTALEVLRRTCVAEIQLLSVELDIYKELEYKVLRFAEQFTANYAEWYERDAFFFSKKPGQSIFKNATRNTVKAPLSLQNIKSIKRKEIKGSRYELLSRWVGITGASFGPNKYLINYRGISGTTFNAYYSQKYKSPGYITSRKVHNWYTYTDSDGTDDLSFHIDNKLFNTEYGPPYRGIEYKETSSIHVPSLDLTNIFKIPGGSNSVSQVFETRLDYGPAQSDLSVISDLSDFKNTYNFYDPQLINKKPPDLKKEEISSYVRIEFENPIGLDTQTEFPNGFIRDAGVEYFTPYIVNLNVGPMGRQGVKYNASVIGMDPYGFDVAVKKIKDDIPTNRKLQGIEKGNFYDWWDHDTGTVLSKTNYLTHDYNGMDLWPEPVFETEFPYYAFDPMQEDIHGGYELDFHLGGGYYFENNSQDWMESLYHYGMGSGKQFDPLRRTSVVGSYILPNGYRKLKAHRSWWSLFVPRNLFIPLRFANIMMSPNTKARDLFGGKGIFSLSPNYWRMWYGNEFENWCSISKSSLSNVLFGTPDTDRTPGEPPEAPNLVFFADSSAGETGEAIDPFTSIRRYFTSSLNYYLSGNYLLYRPQLVTTDLWKYDLSGESEYGLITPPVDAEYDFFDRNFALQFTVHARSANGFKSCKDLGLECANPKALASGPIPLSSGCTADPYCECPAKYLIPKEPEPTYAELQHLYNQINECKLIEERLGKSWLGCEFSNPTSTCSCNCPEQGENFKYYLQYTRTYATFWECPLDLPLKRKAQISQLQAQKIKIKISPNKNIKIGSIVEVINANDIAEATTNKFKKISGKWMVAEIDHQMSTNQYMMELILIRNGLHYNPNSSISPEAILKKQKET